MAISGKTAAQIADSVRDLIASGELAPQTVLPPVRTLAAELGVNRNTAAAAYHRLVTAGIAETHRRGGTVVTGMPQVAHEGVGWGGRLIDLASGNPDPELLPDVLAALRSGDYQQPLYGAPAVEPGLAQWASDHFAEDVPDQAFRLMATNGAVDATERLLNAYLTRGDAVAVENPCFLASIGALRLNGYRTAAVEVDHAGMRPQSLLAALESGARAVVCTPRAHNPTGASLTGERAAELRAILAEHPQVLVIEDDHFSAISAMPYHRITPPGAAHWALVRSLSKFLGPDLRLALVAADAETARRLQTRLSPGTMWVSWLLQHAARELLQDPQAQTLLAGARTAYAERSALLVAQLNTRRISTPAAYRPDGLNVWIDLAATAPGIKAPAVVDALARRGWAVRPGDLFSAGRAEHQALRVTTATLTEEHAREFADDLATVLEHPLPS